jgi:hypothetical protein
VLDWVRSREFLGSRDHGVPAAAWTSTRMVENAAAGLGVAEADRLAFLGAARRRAGRVVCRAVVEHLQPINCSA